MYIIRITVVLLTFVLCSSNASAQLVRSSVTTHAHSNQNNRNDGFHTLSLPFEISGSDSNRVQLSSDGTFTFECKVTNLTQSTDTIYFKRSQLLPVGWGTSVCWGINCYAASVDSVSYAIPPNSSANLLLDVTPCLENVPDSTVVWMRVGMLGSPADTVMIPFYITYQPPNPPLVFQWSGISSPWPNFDTTFTGAGEYTVANLFENGFGIGVDYNFTIHDSLPVGWILTTCVQGIQTTCTTDSSLKAAFDAFGGANFLQAVKFTLNVPELTSTDSAIIYFGVHPKISNPADSATYRFSIVVQNTSGVTPQPAGQAGMVITNTWPNPLHPASTLHIGVQTSQDGPVSTGIYDLDGVQKGTLEFGQLHDGSNDLQVIIPDELSSGEYIIRMQQGNNTPEIARINYIK